MTDEELLDSVNDYLAGRAEWGDEFTDGEPIKLRVASIERRISVLWDMTAVFAEQRDAHGVMDMGAEIQALQRAKAELEALR